MKKFKAAAIIACIFVVFGLGCQTGGQARDKKHDTPGMDKTAEVAPSGMFEGCVKLMAGQRLEYSFTSSGPLSFNVHYHEDSGVSYPVKKEAATSDQGKFEAKVEQYYCLMWTNRGNKPVRLTYRCEPDIM